MLLTAALTATAHRDHLSVILQLAMFVNLAGRLMQALENRIER
jgi:hypothetical protein